MKAPLVSIVLCTYNGEKYLSQQLDSIINQSYQNIEIVIVDDNSTDNTIPLLEKYKQRHEKIRIFLNDQNIGVNKNFFKAISLSKGEYIAISDQDDIWLPNKIDRLMNSLGSDLLIYHDSEYIDADGNRLHKSTRSHHRFVKGYCGKNLLYFNCVSGHAMLFNRKLVSLTPDLPDNFYYDWWFAFTASCFGKINFVEDRLVLYRKHEASFTKNDLSNSGKYRIKHLLRLKEHSAITKPVKILLVKLLSEYQREDISGFSYSLFFLLLKNRDELFFIRKKSTFSIFKFILSECKLN